MTRNKWTTWKIVQAEQPGLFGYVLGGRQVDLELPAWNAVKRFYNSICHLLMMNSCSASSKPHVSRFTLIRFYNTHTHTHTWMHTREDTHCVSSLKEMEIVKTAGSLIWMSRSCLLRNSDGNMFSQGGSEAVDDISNTTNNTHLWKCRFSITVLSDLTLLWG